MEKRRVFELVPAILYYLFLLIGPYWNEINNWLIANKVLVELGVQVFVGLLTVVGWGIVNQLNLQNQRVLIRDNAGLKIYEELAKSFKEFQGAIAQLQARLTVPTRMQMLLEKSRYKVKTEILEQSLREQRTDFELVRQEFHTKYLSFSGLVDIWSSQIFELLPAYRIFIEEHDKLSQLLWKYETMMGAISVEDIDSWNQTDYKKRQNETALYMMIFILYTQDFMVLIHNILAAPLLGQEKTLRSVSESTFPILTKWGIAEPSNPNLGYEYLKIVLEELDVKNRVK